MFCERCRQEIEGAKPEERPVLSSLDLMALPFVAASDYVKLPRCGAVYFALSPGRICYIGTAVDVYLRWKHHHQLQRILAEPEGRIAWLIQSDKAQRDSIEKEAIRHFKPAWNRLGSEFLTPMEIRERFPDVNSHWFRREQFAYDTFMRQGEIPSPG